MKQTIKEIKDINKLMRSFASADEKKCLDGLDLASFTSDAERSKQIQMLTVLGEKLETALFDKIKAIETVGRAGEVATVTCQPYVTQR